MGAIGLVFDNHVVCGGAPEAYPTRGAGVFLTGSLKIFPITDGGVFGIVEGKGVRAVIAAGDVAPASSGSDFRFRACGKP